MSHPDQESPSPSAVAQTDPGNRLAHLRLVHPDDWESHRDLRLEALQDAPDAFWYTYADEAVYDEAAWRERIEGAWLVQALDAQGVIGGAGLGSHWQAERATSGELFGLYVAPRARGRGVGEALVNAVLEQARRLGRTDVVLEVGSNNEAAIALYERCGFVRTGATEPHPRRDDIHEVEMAHRL